MLWLRGNPRNGSWLPSCEFAESDDKLPCPNGSVPWVENTFGECTYMWMPCDRINLYCSIVAVLSFNYLFFFLVECVCVTGSFGNLTEQVLPDKALSFTFLLLWLSGDTANLIGCLLTDQLALQKYTAVYYVSMDSVMISQFLYYKFKNRRSVVTGYVCGSLSCLLYLGSRLPQLNKNFQRKSTDGVSPIMFMLVVMGNLAYGLDILLKQPQTESEGCYILRHLPWIIGSLGTLSLDICISTQFILYRKPLVTSDEVEPLIQ
uniref:Solute carrier family 66 member 1 n=1 Tax=Eptatretus burgeri TaxID=7764 RepID=A0A8C4WS99_EPTBU